MRSGGGPATVFEQNVSQGQSVPALKSQKTYQQKTPSFACTRRDFEKCRFALDDEYIAFGRKANHLSLKPRGGNATLRDFKTLAKVF